MYKIISVTKNSQYWLNKDLLKAVDEYSRATYDNKSSEDDKLEKIKQLLDSGATPDYRINKFGFSAIQIAIFEEQYHILELFLSHGDPSQSIVTNLLNFFDRFGKRGIIGN